ncbi:3'-5' exoribonuclease [Nocardiopsis sp. FR26]|uniref:3'-5' exoribonuclease n=1 Tax=Nocardiopsis sp. FR26 TaxID=2605987 RepID=UPI00135ADE9F|nr:3'-5' exoribonuclease [Nocardiopsis sp. FR26]
MIYAYDTEFLEDGRRIWLISIGIVCEDGREYYAVNVQAPWTRIEKHAWLMANVVPSLPQPRVPHPRCPSCEMPIPGEVIDYEHPAVKHPAQIAAEVREFLLGPANDTQLPQVELWADYPAYDHVALAQLWGPMVDLPEGIPMTTFDLQQAAHMLGTELRPQQEGHHNALSDARHVMSELRRLGLARPEVARG